MDRASLGVVLAVFALVGAAAAITSRPSRGGSLDYGQIERINPLALPDSQALGFTQVAVAPPGAKLVLIAGQYGADASGRLAPGYAAQLERAFANLRVALDAAGATPEDVVKITILSVNHNMDKQRLVVEARNAMWPDTKPASTLIPVPRLAVDGMLFEIEATAVVHTLM